MANRITEIKLILEEYKYLFVGSFKGISIKQSSNKIFLPSESLQSPGILLNNNIGQVYISETIEKNKVIEYTYSFHSEEYECLTYRKGKNQTDCTNFYFHYDKCKNNKPHFPHLSVIYPAIRYRSPDIKLEDFFLFLENTFFKKKKDLCEATDINIWCNRII